MHCTPCIGVCGSALPIELNRTKDFLELSVIDLSVIEVFEDLAIVTGSSGKCAVLRGLRGGNASGLDHEGNRSHPLRAGVQISSLRSRRESKAAQRHKFRPGIKADFAPGRKSYAAIDRLSSSPVTDNPHRPP